MKFESSSQAFFILWDRQLSLKQTDAMVTETWCVERVIAILAGEIGFIHWFLWGKIINIFTFFNMHLPSQASGSATSLFLSPLGWVHFVTVQQLLQLNSPINVAVRIWQSLVQAEETAWNVEPVFATTLNSSKDPTVSMTKPSVRDTEASFATVWWLST